MITSPPEMTKTDQQPFANGVHEHLLTH